MTARGVPRLRQVQGEHNMQLTVAACIVTTATPLQAFFAFVLSRQSELFSDVTRETIRLGGRSEIVDERRIYCLRQNEVGIKPNDASQVTTVISLLCSIHPSVSLI